MAKRVAGVTEKMCIRDRDISALKQLSKQIYRQMVSRTPDIGSMM